MVPPARNIARAASALIHCTAPHGLEQYSGAAWGLRDVCQGPAEFLRATRNYAPLRELLALDSPGAQVWHRLRCVTVISFV